MKPLYQQAKERSLGVYQYNDIETLEWSYEKQKISSINISHIRSMLPQISKNEIVDYIPDGRDFEKNKQNTIHGMRHIVRVMIYAAIISELTKENLDKRILIHSAAIHDIKRRADNDDPDHGYRAAKWFESNLHKFPSLTKIDSELISHIVKLHNSKDIEEAKASKRQIGLKLFKLADALDRFRLPNEKWWPNLCNMNYDFDIEVLLNFSKLLVYYSEKNYLEHNMDNILAVLTAGEKLGVFKNEEN